MKREDVPWIKEDNKYAPRICKQCQKEFIPNVHNQLFCLPKDRVKYYYYNREETRKKIIARRKKYQKAYPERYKKYYNDFLEKHPGYREQKNKEFFKKHPGYNREYHMEYSKQYYIKNNLRAE